MFFAKPISNQKGTEMSLIRYQMPEMSAWPSFDRWASLRDEMSNLLELPFWANSGRQAQLFSGWAPALDLYQNNDNVVAVVELPGMRKEDIEISLHDGTLTISGERRVGAFERRNAPNAASVSLENSVAAFRCRRESMPDKVSATYKDGILTVTLPKAEEAKPKQIKVNVD